MIRVVVSGYTGKMGQEVIRALENEPDMLLVGQAGRNDDLGTVLKDSQADVLVDFTHPDAGYRNIMAALNSGVSVVAGTTGLTQAQKEEINRLASEKKLAVLTAPNFCLGAVLMIKFAAEASKYLPSVEIVEYHHDNKADAPSGTALKTAETILQAAGNTKPPARESENQLPDSSLGGKMGHIRIHSVRLPGFVASQEVLLSGMGETLTIRHDTIGRESFMPGVMTAIRRIAGRTGLIEGLEKLID